MQELGIHQARSWRGWGLTMHWAVLAFALSLLGVGMLRVWLVRLSILDHPGQRRLHHTPIPRGGGLGIVVAVFIAALGVYLMSAPPAYPWVLAGLGVVTVIGWVDDRDSVGILPRLAMHAVAALLLVLGLWVSISGSGATALQIALALLLMLTVIASINLHNFMDGANGVLAVQSLFALAALYLLGGSKQAGVSALTIIAFGATLGFLPWNFPIARVFLGDSGSGALGYLLAAVTLFAWSQGYLNLPEALLVHSLVLIDSLSTLLSRMLRGRRWWQGHREHLYQWLVRGGRSHARVVVLMQAWNLLLIAPILWYLRAIEDSSREPIAFDGGLGNGLAVFVVSAVLVGGVVLRWFLKHRLLRAHRAK